MKDGELRLKDGGNRRKDEIWNIYVFLREYIWNFNRILILIKFLWISFIFLNYYFYNITILFLRILFGILIKI